MLLIEILCTKITTEYGDELGLYLGSGSACKGVCAPVLLWVGGGEMILFLFGRRVSMLSLMHFCP